MRAMRRPPLSALFSPSVSRPLSLTSSTAVKLEYSLAMHAARLSNSAPLARRPPVAQVAVAIELAALVVEPVRHLVADHRSGSAVVERDVAPGVEERRLQDAGGEVDAVVLRAVEGVDRGRRHVPFGFVRRLSDLLDALVVGHLGAAHGVTEEVIAGNGQFAVFAPLPG